MAPTTTHASDALELIQQGNLAIIEQDDDYDLPGVALQLLRCMGSLTDEFPMEAFTDEEIELISETTVVCLDQLMTPTQQGEF